MGGHASEGQPPGVLLLLGEWEVPTHRPKENKPELYNTQCTVSLIKTSLIVSVPHGVGQMEPNQNSTVFKRKSVTVRFFHDYFKSEGLGAEETARLSACSKILYFLDAFLHVMAKHRMLGWWSKQGRAKSEGSHSLHFMGAGVRKESLPAWQTSAHGT